MTEPPKAHACEGHRSAFLGSLYSAELRLTEPESLFADLRRVRVQLDAELHQPGAWPPCLLRAALVLASARLGAVDSDRVCALAAGAEMIWRAIVAHRREVLDGGASDTFQILGNDFVLARALHIYTTDGDLEVMSAISQGAVVLCEGLVGELQTSLEPGVADTRVAEYFAACGRVGAAAGGLDRAETAGLARFAGELGFALGGRGPAPEIPTAWTARSPALAALARDVGSLCEPACLPVDQV